MGGPIPRPFNPFSDPQTRNEWMPPERVNADTGWLGAIVGALFVLLIALLILWLFGWVG